MGLIIYDYLYNEFITYDKVYVNLRNIQLNKENTDFTLSAGYFIYYKDKLVDIKYIKIKQKLIYTEHIWNLLYKLLKQNLNVLNYKFIDY